MSTPLQSARERLASVKARIEREKQERAVRADALRKVNAWDAKRRKPLRGRRTLVLRPGDRIHRASLDLDASAPGYVAGAKDAMRLPTMGKRLARLAELVAAGAIKITPVDGGNGLSAKGLVQKMRLIDRAAEKRIDKAAAAKARAYEAYVRASRALDAQLLAEYGAGEKVSVETVASIVAESAYHHFVWEANRMSTYPEWEQRRDADAIAAAEAHLAHVKSKSKEPCNCPPCVDERRQATWAAQREAQEKARLAREAEDAKRIKAAPKVQFICPACDLSNIAPVLGDGEAVDCQNEDCGVSLTLTAIKYRKVAKSEPVGVEYPDEADEAA